jgi:anti-sigma factor ChrR (cupin superfamily)
VALSLPEGSNKGEKEVAIKYTIIPTKTTQSLPQLQKTVVKPTQPPPTAKLTTPGEKWQSSRARAKTVNFEKDRSRWLYIHNDVSRDI